MEQTFERKKKIMLDDTKFIFPRNLAGDPAKDPTYGSTTRYANIIIPTKEQADDIAAIGLNVRCTKPKPGFEEEFEPTYFLRCILKYHHDEEDSDRDPKVYKVVNGREPVLLTEETVGCLDDVYVLNVNAIINPHYDKRRNQWYAYINIMYVEQDVDSDPYANRYRRFEE